MLGDWDLHSTLLRRTVQAGAQLVPVAEGFTPFLASAGTGPEAFDRHLLRASQSTRRDWPSRYILPPLEQFLVKQAAGTVIQPSWLLGAALLLVLAAALLFTRGEMPWALALLLLATPLDRVADRLATLRLRPLARSHLLRRLLWPAHGVALLAIGWFETRHGGGWGALVAAAATLAFAEAARVEGRGRELPLQLWLFGPKPAVFAAIPFAIAGWWSALTVGLALYAAISFFLVQHLIHQLRGD
jgi:hypothetical protein